jgi:hypothetical protein
MCSAAHRDGTSRAVAGFGPYLGRAAGGGLLDPAKVLLFVANARSRGTELLRPAHFFTGYLGDVT